MDDLRPKVAEERRKSNHAELLGMMTQMGSGREQQLSTAVGAGRHGATPASEHSDVGDGSREGERVPEGAGHFGGRGEDWSHNPTGEQPSNVSDGFRGQTLAGLRGQTFLGQSKMAIPVCRTATMISKFSVSRSRSTPSSMDWRLSSTAANTSRLGPRGTARSPSWPRVRVRVIAYKKKLVTCFFFVAGFGIER